MPLSQGRVPVEDRGFQFGDGIYETIRVVNGRTFRLGDHLKRLSESALGTMIPLEYDEPAMREICAQLLEKSSLREGIIYIQVTRGVSPRNHLPLNPLRPTTIAYTQELSPMTPERWRRGVSAIFHPDHRWGRCDLKTIALLPNVMAIMEAHAQGADDAIFCSAEGIVRECSASNIFCIRNGEVFTPPLSHHVLAGVTRTATLEACGELGLACHETDLLAEDYLRAQEVFLTSTTRNIVPIRSIDRTPIGDGQGDLTRRISERLWEILRRETA